MPNHVTQVLEFSAEHAERVFADCCPNGQFDFNLFIAPPITVYHGSLSMREEEDFKGHNWYAWNLANWGTKWNCYDSSISIEGNVARILFYTAWSIPYPIICAFANKYGIPFQHRYFDEGHMYWGIEAWRVDPWSALSGSTIISRTAVRDSKPEDRDDLCLELQGYHPNPPDMKFNYIVPVIADQPNQPVCVAMFDEEYFSMLFDEDL